METVGHLGLPTPIRSEEEALQSKDQGLPATNTSTPDGKQEFSFNMGNIDELHLFRRTMDV